MRLKFVVAGIASAMVINGAHAEDGARAYFLLPSGTSDIDLTATFLRLESNGSVFDSSVVTPSYRHSVNVSGDAATFLIGLPIGSLSASLNTPVGTVNLATNPAQGDLFVGATLGLVGSPALTPMEYAQFRPGLAISVSTKVFLPTGNYDSSRLLNLGQNRWSIEASLPISYVLGGSLLDPELTTFEIEPSVQIFGDNKEPFGGPTMTSQAPLFGVESHVTHNFTHTVWASVDGSAEFGGETSVNGVASGDAQQSVSAGATLGLSLTQSIALRLSGEQQVYSNMPGSARRTFMATSAFLF